jgi:hypothetical protein
MFGDVVTIEAGAVIGLGDGHPVGIELTERHTRIVDVIEDSEFHTFPTPSQPLSGTMLADPAVNR